MDIVRHTAVIIIYVLSSPFVFLCYAQRRRALRDLTVTKIFKNFNRKYNFLKHMQILKKHKYMHTKSSVSPWKPTKGKVIKDLIIPVF